MKKIINDPKNYVQEYLQGVIAAHGDWYELSEESARALLLKNRVPGKVAIVTGGGSGHMPLFLGYVGKGLCDACAVGNVFASPSSAAMEQAARDVEDGAGVLYLFGNYGGDRMNFDMAAEELSDDGIEVRQVWGTDDVASSDDMNSRRGVAGILFVYKAAGAAAARMMSLDEVEAIARKANFHTRSMGVALSACTLPEVGKPSFEIGEDEMEIGMGIHGEPGIQHGKLSTANEIAEQLVSTILNDFGELNTGKVAVLVNLLGGTAKEEGYIFYRKVKQLLDDKNIEVRKVLVGEYSTSMEMAGLSLSVMMLDDELESLLSDYASSPFVTFEKDWK